jgi:hypothetical protein
MCVETTFCHHKIHKMHLIRSITLAAIACSFAESFVPPVPNTVQPAHPNGAVELRATADTEAERLLRKVRELRKEAKAGEDELHTTLIQRKKTRDAATDSIIAQLFPIVKVADGNDVSGGDGVCALCDRLRERRLAADVLVRVVERLHEREVAARGLEHVEPSVHHDQVTFVRVAQPDEAELRKVQGLVDRLIEAAEVLDGEFIEEKSECNGRIVSVLSELLPNVFLHATTRTHDGCSLYHSFLDP